MDLDPGKLFICRHVRFDEGVFPLARSPSVQVPSSGVQLEPWGAGSVVPAAAQAPSCDLVVDDDGGV